MLELGALVDDYVFGHAMRARATREQRDQERWEQKLEGLIKHLEAQLETGEFPILAKWADGDVRRGFERIGELAADPDRFERGLQTLLDGIDVRLRGPA